MTNVEARPVEGERRDSRWTLLILVCGVLVVPGLLVLLTNSTSAPDAPAYVRMAFATVAGQTVAIATVLWLLAAKIATRDRLSKIITFAAIAVAVTIGAMNIIGNTADLLLQRLELVG